MAFFCRGFKELINARTFSPRRFSSSCFSYSGATALALALEAQRVQSAISREGEQPGNKRSAALIILTGIAPELEENVLGHFFGRPCLLQDAEQEAVDKARMAVG